MRFKIGNCYSYYKSSSLFVFDIDISYYNSFNEIDKKYLEEIVEYLEQILNI